MNYPGLGNFLVPGSLLTSLVLLQEQTVLNMLVVLIQFQSFRPLAYKLCIELRVVRMYFVL